MNTAPVPTVGIVVVAAGSGTRLGAGAPKAFVGIDGASILHHALRNVGQIAGAQIVIVAPEGREGEALAAARSAVPSGADLVAVVRGGPTRQQSVAAGLAALWPSVRSVLVHDAARALTPPAVFERVIEELGAGADAAIPVLPVVDTLKRVDGQHVIAAVDRAALAAAQTPQGFRRDVLDRAYAETMDEFTDDAALVAAAGGLVRVVAGDPSAFKITGPDDLARARSMLAQDSIPRVGIGTDVHAFGGDGNLWLAGVEWPGEPALSGHSDGDAVAHAVVDALLAAAGLGDIGTHFGTSHPEYAGAHADVFLARTRAILAEAGWRIGSVSVQFQSNRPRFSTRREEAQRVLSDALGGAPVSVTATTTDGLGFTGAGEGLSAFAVAVITR
ncbi:2-C-methyl-D-erythritol 4-phosphate cytidylyltransferase [Microbacterium sp. C7(2022)]|uniref:2-C-methyl-D-erythritol 4-phosphate cytidylyltransferase n=1 Tax=Microbacterium sp. C7(2022) TaxID=2992759 RepID=UPI00237BA2D9|nr:2-C-methyl-D-erythritol 4-phosphate cytidylyltransferase [Microbacterium sp. C7(2022)]MDE0547131.1 2-C-methyl-D-erythritol 4-phosphate cytidylyltransferase [Microbacterium sp. C7(2022)]